VDENLWLPELSAQKVMCGRVQGEAGELEDTQTTPTSNAKPSHSQVSSTGQLAKLRQSDSA